MITADPPATAPRLQQRDDEHRVAETVDPMPSPQPHLTDDRPYPVAASVYVLIDDEKLMGTDMRVMWFLKRLGCVLKVDEYQTDQELSSELCKIVSFVPRDANTTVTNHVDRSNSPNDSNRFFTMDSLTRVYYLTSVYTMVYCLDMSPSNCSVDIQRGHVMLDEMIVALQRSIQGFIRPFIIPGSHEILFEPQVYVTVIVHTPFYTSLAQQVLVQGWRVNNHNFSEFIKMISCEMTRLENAVAQSNMVSWKTTNSDDENISSSSDDDFYDANEPSRDERNQIAHMSVGGTSRSRRNNLVSNAEKNMKITTTTNNNSPDSGFINTLRYGMLAVRLLPRSSISNLIVITDGMITLADIQVLDSVLNQLRCIGVACSFMHVSSQFHPHSCHGLVPYSELMQLIATATMGTYLNTFPDTDDDSTVNYYHEKFVLWTFRKGDDASSNTMSSNNTSNLSCTPPRVRHGEWTVKNSNFYGNRQTQLLTKRQINDHLQAHLDNVVCCRMREGFIVEDIQFRDAGSSSTNSKLQLKFVLPWTNHIYIEYDLTVKWPPPSCSLAGPVISQGSTTVQSPPVSVTQSTHIPIPSQSDTCLNIHYVIVVKGPYEFLRDITTSRSKKSQNQNHAQSFQQRQYQLSSSSSSVTFPPFSTTVTSATVQPDNGNPIANRGIVNSVTSKYRQALITRFWSTMRSIGQTDLLVKHLETYSPSTGHLVDYNSSSQTRQYEQQIFDNQQVQRGDQLNVSPSSPNSSSKTEANKFLANTVVAAATIANLSPTGIPNRSPLRSGMPLFYHLPTTTTTSALKQQLQVKLNDQQQNYTDHQHQQYADFWKPVCTLDPDAQWPRWFSTYRIGGGVLLLRHDRPLPRWLHVANTVNGRYQTLTCRKAAESLFAMLKQWCTFVLIDDHSYVKCLNRNETYTSNVSFCIARVTLRPPCCCCVVLHVAFQSCVPATVHHKIVDDLKKRVQQLDSTMTTASSVLTTTTNKNDDSGSSSEHRHLHARRKSVISKIVLKKNKRPKKYVRILDKPLEKILIRYERMPSQFTTVIFPDGTQPNSIIVASPVTTNFHFPNPTANSGRQQLNQRGISDRRLSTTSTTTTTLSRYLYHRRWIWSSGHSQLSNSTSQQQQQQQQLARTLSILTKIRLREGFRFAHSSAGIINMVLQVDMTEASSLDKNKLSETSTTTSHCLIQYVLFPPHIISKHQPLDHDADDVNDSSKTKVNDDNRSLIYSSDEEDQRPEKYKRQERNINVETTNSGKSSIEDDYQLITECWIEPQHGSVVVGGDKNNEYMSGLMYEQLADAMWLVDADCISSLFTFQHMQHMCMDSGVSVSSFDYDPHRRRRDKNKISIDGGRIYKLPFDFSLVNLLPKCRRHSSITFNLFSTYSAIDGNKLNAMLERAFYAELRTINDRSFDVSGADGLQGAKSADAAKKDLHEENGQCYVKRLNNSRLILTVTPSCGKSPEKRFEFPENTDWQPACRLRSNTWHYCNRTGTQSCPPRPQDRYSSREAFSSSSSSSVQYYRAMSVGSKPASHSNDMSWARFRLERNFCPSTIMDSQCFDAGSDEPVDESPLDFAPTMAVVVYDCRRLTIERALVSKNVSPGDDPVAMADNNGISDESCCSSSTPTSDEDEDEDTANYTAADPMVTSQKDETILDRYLVKIQQAYDRCLVTTVFRALHLGLDVRYLDVQSAVDRCQHQMMTFDITDYIKVVCGHFKNNNSFTSCPEENKTLKLHHDMIRSKFAATLRRHMLQSVASHPDYYFYCCTAKNKFDQEESYKNDTQSSSESIVNQGPDSTRTNKMSKQCLHTEVSEDPTPLFVHLVCSVKTDTMTKSRSVRSLPTCILELMDKDNDDEPFDLTDIDFNNVRVSLDVYCLILANPDDDGEEDYDDDGSKDKMNNKNGCIDPTQLTNHGTSYSPLQKSNESHNKPLLSSLPVRYARGLAAFIAEVEWCMRDEMAAGLLEDSTVTPETLDKVIQHVSNSSSSSSNGHQEIPVYFVEPPLGSSNYNSISLFVQQLDQMDIVLDQDNGGGLYALAKSSNDTFYVVKKKLTSNTSTDSTISDVDSHAAIGSDSEDCLTKAEQSRPSLPNFWIILKIQSKQSDDNNSLAVMLYFHCRFTELDVRGRYAAVREDVRQHIYRAATVVNQTLLLCRLHDTRMCDPILEPITENHVNSDDDDTSNGDTEKKSNHFTFGQFRCPVVWTAKFMLHPRLQHSSSILLLGVQVLHSVLDKLSVRNRRNMFVYREESSGSVFYLRLYENTLQQHIQNQKNLLLDTVQSDSDDEDSISRCSSATSTTATIASSINPPSYNPHSLRKPSDDINYMDTRSNQTLGSRSLGGTWADADSKEVEYLTLKVHGISPVGTEIRVQLVEVLQNRLNDAVLEVLTTMLYRNPVCRLYPDDVRFVQPLETPADIVIKFSLPVDIRIKKSLVHNLQRNAVALLLHPPKYASRHQRFVVNNPGPEKPLVRCFFIYNQQSSAGIGGIRTSGNRGLACVLFEVHLNDYKNNIDTMSNYPTDPSLFESRVRPSLFVADDPTKLNADVKAYTKIHVWRRGRITEEALQGKLTVIIKNTLWDVSVEQFLKEQPIAIESDQQPPACHLNPLYTQHLARWIAFGARTSAPLARHSRIQHKISVDHVLREFKTHLSWTGTSTSNGSTLFVRYFYAERSPYGQLKPFSRNLVAGLLDPLQLDDTCADTVLSDNLVFHEWQPSADTVNGQNSVSCPPSATCVLVLVSVVTSTNSKREQEKRRHRIRPIRRSDSDTENGLIVVEDEENAEDNEDEVTDSDKEDNTKTITNVNQLGAINIGSHEEAKRNGTNNDNGRIINRQKLSRLLLLALSGRALHTLTYNWNNGGDDNSISVRRLCGWLEWRRAVYTSTVLYKLGLINPRAYNATLISHSAGVKNNVDLLLDYKGYTAAMGDHEYGERIGGDKVTRTSGRVKYNDTDTEEKKIKSNVYEKDVQDLYLERSVRIFKQQRRLDLHRKCLYDMWTHSDERVISKETLWTFYRHSRLLHYCLTPLLFLPRWRLESAATRDHSLDAYKTRTTEPPPLWHRKLCARFSQAYAEYIETHPTVTGFQLIQIGKQQHTGHHHAANDSTGNETDLSKATTCYLKKSVSGMNGGLLLIETGVSQPFYYVKMSCVERARLANNSDEPDDYEDQQQYTLLDQSERIVHNMHLHSFTYDFHVRILTDRLGKLIKNIDNNQFVINSVKRQQPQQTSMLNKSAAQINNASKLPYVPKINAIAGFLDDFLRYYNHPPTYSRCLVQSNIFRRTQMPVTGRQLYEYLLANSNTGEDADGMSVIKISGYVMGEGDNGKSLFDDDGDDDNNRSVGDENFQNKSDNSLLTSVDLTDYVLVQRMSNDMHLKKCPSSEFDSHLGGSESDFHESRSDCGFENCNMYNATLVLSLSSKHCLGLDGSRDVPPDSSNEIALSYYVLLTVNENVDLENKNEPVGSHIGKTSHQRHSTPIHKQHDQMSNVTVSTSVPCGSYNYTMASDSATCWGGSLDEINSNMWCPTPPNTRQRWNSPSQNDHLYNHHKYKVLKEHLTCCYGQRAAELVAQTLDTAASRCRVHMLWRTFSMQSDQQKSGLSALSFDELEELVTKAGLIEPLAVYDPRIGLLLEQLSVGPQWFGSLHKLLVSTSSSPRLTTRCRLYSSYNAEHQYLVVLPAQAATDNDQVDVFVLISNKSINRSGQPINIVYRKACNNSTDNLENIVEAVGRAVCYFVWRAAMSATANLTPSVSSNSSQQ